MLPRRLLSFALLGLWLLSSRPIRAQPPLAVAAATWLAGQITIANWPGHAIEPPMLSESMRYLPERGANDNLRRTPRFQLFGMPPAFLCDPLGLDSGDDPNLIEDAGASYSGPGDDDLGTDVRVAMGEDNLYLDPRRQGEPGGAGFWKVQSLLQLVDLEATSLCLGLQAVMPAGPETGGVDSGPTVLSPSLAWFHDLGEGAAVHGFVGQQIQANSRWRNHLGADVQCGMAVQYPVLSLESTSAQGLYVFLQALGRLNDEADLARRKRPAWEVVPGLHWRMNERCWLSMGGSRLSLITCSWKY